MTATKDVIQNAHGILAALTNLAPRSKEGTPKLSPTALQLAESTRKLEVLDRSPTPEIKDVLKEVDQQLAAISKTLDKGPSKKVKRSPMKSSSFRDLSELMSNTPPLIKKAQSLRRRNSKTDALPQPPAAAAEAGLAPTTDNPIYSSISVIPPAFSGEENSQAQSSRGPSTRANIPVFKGRVRKMSYKIELGQHTYAPVLNSKVDKKSKAAAKRETDFLRRINPR